MAFTHDIEVPPVEKVNKCVSCKTKLDKSELHNNMAVCYKCAASVMKENKMTIIKNYDNPTIDKYQQFIYNHSTMKIFTQVKNINGIIVVVNFKIVKKEIKILNIYHHEDDIYHIIDPYKLIILAQILKDKFVK